MSSVQLAGSEPLDAWGAGAAAYQKWFEPLTARYVVNVLNLLALQPNERLLDVGCGAGSLLVQAAEAHLDVLGVDLAAGMVEFARARLAELGLAATVDVMDAERLSVPVDGFDAAVALFSVIFCPDPARAAAELARVVRPGGQVLVASWDADGFPMPAAVAAALTDAVPGGRLPGPPSAMPLDRPDKVRALLEDAGFDEVSVIEVTHEWPIDDPAAFFTALPDWAVPIRGIFAPLGAAEIRAGAVAFAGLADRTGRRTLRTTALFGHGRVPPVSSAINEESR